MKKIQEVNNEISIGKVTSTYKSKIDSLINGSFSEMVKKDLSEKSEEEPQEEPTALNSHQVLLQNQAYLNKLIITNVA